MPQGAKAPRQNRTITVDFHDEATYAQLLDEVVWSNAADNSISPKTG